MRKHHFDGTTYDATQDGPRLSRQLDLVRVIMSDGHWRTLEQIASAVGCSEASASARLCDLRKARFGGHVVDRQRIAGGLHFYRMGGREGQ